MSLELGLSMGTSGAGSGRAVRFAEEFLSPLTLAATGNIQMTGTDTVDLSSLTIAATGDVTP